MIWNYSQVCSDQTFLIFMFENCNTEFRQWNYLYIYNFACRTRQPGVKFIIILDRRLDTWASIKTALARIAVSYIFHTSISFLLDSLDNMDRTEQMFIIVGEYIRDAAVWICLYYLWVAVHGAENLSAIHAAPLRSNYCFCIKSSFGLYTSMWWLVWRVA